jgi:hypothetical protein
MQQKQINHPTEANEARSQPMSFQAAEARPLAADDRKGRTDVCGGSNIDCSHSFLMGFQLRKEK